jgi:hypothetical protein
MVASNEHRIVNPFFITKFTVVCTAIPPHELRSEMFLRPILCCCGRENMRANDNSQQLSCRHIIYQRRHISFLFSIFHLIRLPLPSREWEEKESLCSRWHTAGAQASALDLPLVPGPLPSVFQRLFDRAQSARYPPIVYASKRAPF